MADLIDIIDDAIRDETEDTTPDIDADFTIVSDTSATAPKKVLLKNLVGTVLAALRSAFTPASSSTQATLKLHEDTDNGVNYIELKPPASVSANRSHTLPDEADGTLATQAHVTTTVNAAVAGLSWKQAVRVATTVAGTLATSFENGDTVDGVVLATGDRILIKDQAAPAENGIYVVAASGAPARASDADSGAEFVNASVYVSEGTANADKQFVCTTNATITVGVTGITFTEFSSGSSSDSFKTIQVSGQSDVVADSATDTLILAAGSNITITTNAGTDTVTIAASGGSGLDTGKVYALSSGLALP